MIQRKVTRISDCHLYQVLVLSYSYHSQSPHCLCLGRRHHIYAVLLFESTQSTPAIDIRINTKTQMYNSAIDMPLNMKYGMNIAHSNLLPMVGADFCYGCGHAIIRSTSEMIGCKSFFAYPILFFWGVGVNK